MATSSKDINLYKLICIFMHPGTEAVIKKLNLKISNKYASFPNFLDGRKHDLFHLCYKFTCCLCTNNLAKFPRVKGFDKFHWQKLYIQRKATCSHGVKDCSCLYFAMPQIQENDLDLSLAIFLLLNLFPLPEGEKQDLINLRHYRNEYYGHLSSATAKLEGDCFHKMFNDTASTIESIAYSCGPDIYRKISEQIQEIEDTSAHDICKHTIQMLQHFREVTREQLIDIATEQFRKLTEELKKEFILIHKRNAMNNCRCNENSQSNRSKEDSVDHSNNEEKCLHKVLRKKFENMKQKDKKFKSINCVEQQQPNRVSICKRYSSKTLPSIKCNGCEYTGPIPHEDIESIDTLKEEEKYLISTLMQKCKTGNVQDVETLTNDLSNDCKLLRVHDSAGYCALHHAADRFTKDSISIIKNLIFHGVKAIDRTKTGKTALHFACKNGDTELCKYLLSMCPDILNIEDIYGWNAILYAAYNGHTEVIKIITGEFHEVQINSSQLNVNILHMACQVGHLELSTYVLKKFPLIVHDVDNEERTLMHYVARGGNTEIFDYLLKKSHVKKPWKKFQRLSQGKRNPLHIACLYGHTEMSREIISKFPRMLHDKDEEGLHAVHYAAVGGNVEVMILLIDFLDDKVREFIRSPKTNINILQMACVYQKTNMVKFIIKKFPMLLSELDAPDKWNISHIAARSGNAEVLEILSAQDLSLVKEVDLLERNVLHIGCLYSKVKVCKYLLSRFPEMVDHRDIDGCRPIVLAAWAGNLDVLKILLKNDTKENIITDKFNILDIAEKSSECSNSIIDFIKENYPELQLANNQYRDIPINGATNAEFVEMEYIHVNV